MGVGGSRKIADSECKEGLAHRETRGKVSELLPSHLTEGHGSSCFLQYLSDPGT